MDIVVSNSSGVPIYQQIYDQLCSQILQGQLERDSCLPSIRTVSKELHISVITVKRAWEELERNGFIYTMAGKGCFVAPLHAHDLTSKRNDIAIDRLKKDIAYYRSLGLNKPELLELIDRYFDD